MSNSIYPVGTRIRIKNNYSKYNLPGDPMPNDLRNAIGIKEDSSTCWYFPDWEAVELGHDGGHDGGLDKAEYGRWYIGDEYVEPIHTKKLEDYM